MNAAREIAALKKRCSELEKLAGRLTVLQLQLARKTNICMEHIVKFQSRRFVEIGPDCTIALFSMPIPETDIMLPDGIKTISQVHLLAIQPTTIRRKK